MVSSLTLRDFRSYPALDLALEPGLVLVAGPNGAGKTNLLESLHVAIQGYSPRTRVDANLVRFGGAGFDVRAAGRAERGDVSLEVEYRGGEGKRARVNGEPAWSMESLRAEATALVFTPDRLAVVKAGPAVRRAYVDRVVGRVFPARVALAAEYAEALSQRNAALRRVAAALADAGSVDPWDERLLVAAESLAAARAAAVGALSPGFGERAGELGLEQATLAYEPSAVTAEVLADRFSADVERGLTGAGPHHDELRITAGERSLRAHGSQGEQRVAVLALLLAEAELLAARRSVPPLLLLDDVLSELDGDRRAALVERIRGAAQVLVTAAARGALPGDPDQLLEVRPGRVDAA
ncbi:MAG TPA: DNA replication and repair protein RecF [Gaiellaceae bacterium]|nr:DNA replication and repair protein RecF [Gaiellaceae bacterium]